MTVRLTTITVTHDYNGHRSRDVDLARRISGVDISVPHDQADARVAAALAAGAHRVNEQRPWVLADPEGNEACVGATFW